MDEEKNEQQASPPSQAGQGTVRPPVSEQTKRLEESEDWLADTIDSDVSAGTSERIYGDFEVFLEQEVGKGGMGVVYKARQLSLNRMVALKVCRRDGKNSSEARIRFSREAEIAGSIHSDYVINVYMRGEVDGNDYIAMEYVDGLNCRDILGKVRLFTEQQVLVILRDMCYALNVIAGHGIVHRDIKPANIMISRSGQVKLADFGIAKKMSEVSFQDGVEVTQVTSMLGTPQYISPEQSYSPANVDHRSDLYSLGMTAYHLLTGTPPYPGKDIIKIINAQRNVPLPKIPSVSSTTNDIIHRMTEKSPDDRYRSANDLLEAILPLLTEVDSSAVLAELLRECGLHVEVSKRFVASVSSHHSMAIRRRSRTWLYWLVPGLGGLVAALYGVYVFLNPSRVQDPLRLEYYEQNLDVYSGRLLSSLSQEDLSQLLSIMQSLQSVIEVQKQIMDAGAGQDDGLKYELFCNQRTNYQALLRRLTSDGVGGLQQYGEQVRQSLRRGDEAEILRLCADAENELKRMNPLITAGVRLDYLQEAEEAEARQSFTALKECLEKAKGHLSRLNIIQEQLKNAYLESEKLFRDMASLEGRFAEAADAVLDAAPAFGQEEASAVILRCKEQHVTLRHLLELGKELSNRAEQLNNTIGAYADDPAFSELQQKFDARRAQFDAILGAESLSHLAAHLDRQVQDAADVRAESMRERLDEVLKASQQLTDINQRILLDDLLKNLRNSLAIVGKTVQEYDRLTSYLAERGIPYAAGHSVSYWQNQHDDLLEELQLAEACWTLLNELKLQSSQIGNLMREGQWEGARREFAAFQRRHADVQRLTGESVSYLGAVLSAWGQEAKTTYDYAQKRQRQYEHRLQAHEQTKRKNAADELVQRVRNARGHVDAQAIRAWAPERWERLEQRYQQVEDRLKKEDVAFLAQHGEALAKDYEQVSLEYRNELGQRWAAIQAKLKALEEARQAAQRAGAEEALKERYLAAVGRQHELERMFEGKKELSQTQERAVALEREWEGILQEVTRRKEQVAKDQQERLRQSVAELTRQRQGALDGQVSQFLPEVWRVLEQRRQNVEPQLQGQGDERTLRAVAGLAQDYRKAALDVLSKWSECQGKLDALAMLRESASSSASGATLHERWVASEAQYDALLAQVQTASVAASLALLEEVRKSYEAILAQSREEEHSRRIEESLEELRRRVPVGDDSKLLETHCKQEFEALGKAIAAAIREGETCPSQVSVADIDALSRQMDALRAKAKEAQRSYLAAPKSLTCQVLAGTRVVARGKGAEVSVVATGEGVAFFKALVPGGYRIEASKEGYEPAVKDITLTHDDRLVLEQRQIRLQLEIRGVPAEAAVRLHEGAQLRHEAKANAEGVCLLKEVPYGSYRLEVVAQGYERKQMELALKQNQLLDIHLEKNAYQRITENLEECQKFVSVLRKDKVRLWLTRRMMDSLVTYCNETLSDMRAGDQENNEAIVRRLNEARELYSFVTDERIRLFSQSAYTLSSLFSDAVKNHDFSHFLKDCKDMSQRDSIPCHGVSRKVIRDQLRKLYSKLELERNSMRLSKVGRVRYEECMRAIKEIIK